MRLRRAESPFIRYARLTAGAFVLVSVYTIVVKLPTGELRDDWAHTGIHVATGLVAGTVGWVTYVGARLFTASLGVVYGALGIAGWFTDGLLLSHEFAVPLEPADNVFHLVLAAGAAWAVVAARVTRRRRSSVGLVRDDTATPIIRPPRSAQLSVDYVDGRAR